MESTILIVDDEMSARENISAILEGRGYHLEFAPSGLEAIQITRKLNPDLILLDIMMPGMDGYQVCKIIRDDPNLREIPILLLTALEDRESRLNGLGAGADDFLSKPLDPQELRARVATIIRLNRYRTLLDQRDDLKAMAKRVLQAQEQERKQISREIHDDIGQSLIVHNLHLRSIYESLPKQNEELRKSIDELLTESTDIYTKLHLLAQNLRPPLLNTLGIGMAMHAFCDDFSRHSGLPTQFEADVEDLKVPELVAITLYRVMQEALTNIVKHSRATQGWVTLNVEDDEISFSVQDNGIGFLAGQVEQKGLGLQGMQERVMLAGGEFNVRTGPGKGTVVSVLFPGRMSEEQS